MLNDLLFMAGEVTPPAYTTALTTAFTSGAAEMKDMISSIAPIGVGVMVAGMVVIFGIKFFKKITGKA